jgi:hypothetical protein
MTRVLGLCSTAKVGDHVALRNEAAKERIAVLEVERAVGEEGVAGIEK